MGHTTALAMVVWYLTVPVHLPETRAIARELASATVFNTYRTREACEQDRRRLSNDPDIGDRMRVAECSEIGPSMDHK